MTLPYTGETLVNPEGKTVPVLDRARVDFSQAGLGRKKTEMKVRRANGGEVIETRDTQGRIETVYTAKKGDAIFTNLHDAKDTYVPGHVDGTRWQFDSFLKKGYEITGGSIESGEVMVQGTVTSKILHEAVTEDMGVKDAWGKGLHQYLYKGATLKISESGQVIGIDKAAFDATWEILPTDMTVKRAGLKP